MSAQQFHGEVRPRGPSVLLDLSGDIDGNAEQGLRALYHEAVAGGPATVVLNFEQVSYINSTGIALIVGLLAEARKAHQTVLACGLSPHYQEIFQVTRLSDFMPMFSDEDAALAGTPSPAPAS
ncbi:MAG: STAS domain-containing protein [Actinomycetota bacterium]|nr:STAS domain-containing protein [Actinomycetota bacterium]